MRSCTLTLTNKHSAGCADQENIMESRANAITKATWAQPGVVNSRKGKICRQVGTLEMLTRANNKVLTCCAVEV